MKTIDCNKFNKDLKKWSGFKKKKKTLQNIYVKYTKLIHRIFLEENSNSEVQNIFGQNLACK